MAKKATKGSRRNSSVLKDYETLEKMFKDLGEHQKNIKQMNLRISKGMDSYNKYGLIDVLSMVSMHMERARKELEKARKELKLI